jgi:hypothetical protein
MKVKSLFVVVVFILVLVFRIRYEIISPAKVQCHPIPRQSTFVDEGRELEEGVRNQKSDMGFNKASLQ